MALGKHPNGATPSINAEDDRIGKDNLNIPPATSELTVADCGVQTTRRSALAARGRTAATQTTAAATRHRRSIRSSRRAASSAAYRRASHHPRCERSRHLSSASRSNTPVAAPLPVRWRGDDARSCRAADCAASDLQRSHCSTGVRCPQVSATPRAIGDAGAAGRTPSRGRTVVAAAPQLPAQRACERALAVVESLAKLIDPLERSAERFVTLDRLQSMPGFGQSAAKRV